MTTHANRRSGLRRKKEIKWAYVALGITVIFAAGYFAYSRLSDVKETLEPVNFDEALNEEAASFTSENQPTTTSTTNTGSGGAITVQGNTSVSNRETNGARISNGALWLDNNKIISIHNIPQEVAISNQKTLIANQAFLKIIASPSSNHIAFSTLGEKGVTFGWILDVTDASNRPHPVIFSSEGDVDPVIWTNDESGIVFTKKTTADPSGTLTIKINDLPTYPRVTTD